MTVQVVSFSQRNEQIKTEIETLQKDYTFSVKLKINKFLYKLIKSVALVNVIYAFRDYRVEFVPLRMKHLSFSAYLCKFSSLA